MKKNFFASLAILLFASVGFAQEDVHSDIEFGYDDFEAPQAVVVESDELTSEGIQITEGDFITLGSETFADNPGFITPLDEGLRVNPNDRITVRFLNAADETEVGVGFINFYDPATGGLSAAGRIEISNQPGDLTILDGPELVAGSEDLLLSFGSDGTLNSNAPEDENELLAEGEIHNHLIFDLRGERTEGAYGILFQIEADFADENGDTDGVVDVTSAPVWLILNNGLDEQVFEEEAVAAFSIDVLLGDLNGDDVVNFLDISPFISLLSTGGFELEADFDGNGEVNFLDISPFIGALSGS